MVTPDTRKVIQDGEAYSVIRWDVELASEEHRCFACQYSRGKTVAYIEAYTPQRKVSYQNTPLRARHSQTPVCAEHVATHVEKNAEYAYAMADL